MEDTYNGVLECTIDKTLKGCRVARHRQFFANYLLVLALGQEDELLQGSARGHIWEYDLEPVLKHLDVTETIVVYIDEQKHRVSGAEEGPVKAVEHLCLRQLMHSNG